LVYRATSELGLNCYQIALVSIFASGNERSLQIGFLKQGIGTSSVNFLKATIAGGLLFLLPVVLILIILGHAMRLAGKIAKPISELLPDAVVGDGVVAVLAALVLVRISFLAGLVARTIVGRRIMGNVENSLLGGIPQYQLMKSMAEGLAKVQNAKGVHPALISIDGGWRIGYLLELLEKGWIAVFLPQAPTPMSGNVMYMPANRVRPLGITMVQAMAIVKGMGVESGEVLRRAEGCSSIGTTRHTALNLDSSFSQPGSYPERKTAELAPLEGEANFL